MIFRVLPSSAELAYSRGYVAIPNSLKLWRTDCDTFRSTVRRTGILVGLFDRQTQRLFYPFLQSHRKNQFPCSAYPADTQSAAFAFIGAKKVVLIPPTESHHRPLNAFMGHGSAGLQIAYAATWGDELLIEKCSSFSFSLTHSFLMA